MATPPFTPSPPCIKAIDTTTATYQKLLKGFGGWDDVKKTLTPIRYEALLTDGEDGFIAPEWACDCIALAFENGYLASEVFPGAVFESKADFEAFCESLADHDLFWVNDRHFAVFFELLGNEEECVTYSSIGDGLLTSFSEE
jgi:hypothetical protein